LPYARQSEINFKFANQTACPACLNAGYLPLNFFNEVFAFYHNSDSSHLLMNKPFKAFLFDLNGTIIDDMDYHIRAWHKIFNDLGVPLTYAETKAQCYGKNEEVMERVLPGKFSGKEKKEMGIKKEKQYQEEFRPHLELIDGLATFFEETREAGIRMAIGSAAIRFNIDFVLDGLNIRRYFDSIISADDVTHSKPHPETFLQCAGELGVAPGDCLVFEDAPKGVECAVNAGMKSVVLTTMHTEDEFEKYDAHIMAYGKNYKTVSFRKFLPLSRSELQQG
jgi:beta-phosphoglucomutase family hydrolase